MDDPELIVSPDICTWTFSYPGACMYFVALLTVGTQVFRVSGCRRFTKGCWFLALLLLPGFLALNLGFVVMTAVFVPGICVPAHD
jgi:hypothetical protein